MPVPVHIIFVKCKQMQNWQRTVSISICNNFVMSFFLVASMQTKSVAITLHVAVFKTADLVNL